MVSEDIIRSKGGRKVGIELMGCVPLPLADVFREATAIGLVQSHDSGGTSQSSSLTWMMPSLEEGVREFEATFDASTEETVCAVSVARTSQRSECMTRLDISKNNK